MTTNRKNKSTSNNLNENNNQRSQNASSQSNNANRSQSSSKSTGTRGGSHEQHVKAGHLGGVAPHECRGRECSKNEGTNSNGRHNGRNEK